MKKLIIIATLFVSCIFFVGFNFKTHDVDPYYYHSYDYSRAFSHLFYIIPGPFADLAGREATWNWEQSRTVEQMENEMAMVAFIQYFNISKEDFTRANDQMRRTGERLGGDWEVFPVDILFTFDTDLINAYFARENTPIARSFGVYFEASYHQPLFYNLAPPFVELVGWLDFLQWRLNRSEYERSTENIAVSFIRYFDISREDFEAANEYMRFVWLNYGFANEEARVRSRTAGHTRRSVGPRFDLYPVDLIFTFDNELINEYFRWENSHHYWAREEMGIFVNDITAAAITVASNSSIATGTGNFTISDVTWSANQSATVTLYANPGYTFAGLRNAFVSTQNITINGSPATIVLNTGGRLTISYSFAPPYMPTGQVRINGRFIQIPEYDQQPVIVNGRMLVPLRAVMEELGFTALWGRRTQIATLTRANHIVNVYIGVPSMHVNGRAVPLDVPAQLMNDRTMVPLRAIAEATGFRVEWDEENFIADIFTE